MNEMLAMSPARDAMQQFSCLVSVGVYENYGVRYWKLFYKNKRAWAEEQVIGSPKQDLFFCDVDKKWVQPLVKVTRLIDVIVSSVNGSIRRPNTVLYRKRFTCSLCKNSLGTLDYALDSFPLSLKDVIEEEVDSE